MILPSIFISHGSPSLVLNNGSWAKTLRNVGKKIENLKPELILVVSAHWLTDGTKLECSKKLKTIYDFYGFEKDLYRINYDVEGNSNLTSEIAKKINGECITGRGIDHGAWTVLWHMFPEKTIPVSQLSIDKNKSLKEHLEIGKKLKEFRDRVLIICSGGAVHNIRNAFLNPDKLPNWAVEFKEFLKEKVINKDINALLNYRNEIGKLAHPTDDHLIPIFYFLKTLYENETVNVLFDDFEIGSISLLSFISEVKND